jgi:DoxX-like family
MKMFISVKRKYKIAISLFCSLFIGSVIYGFVDIQESVDEYRHLEFPAWLLYPLSVAKVLGVYVILKSTSQTLKDFAYAGFPFDLLCALGGHIAQQEIKMMLPIVSIGLWIYTFMIDRKYSRMKNITDKAVDMFIVSK